MAHLTPSGLTRLHEAMSARVERDELPGVVTLLASGDEVKVDPIGTFGFDSDQPMRRDTVFRIASLTKPIAGAATMMLIEDGVISLDEPVDRLLPELADRRVLRRIDGPLDDTVPARRPITVEDLLTNRLGFGQITEPEFDPPYPIVNAHRDLDLVLGPPDPRTPHSPDEWMARFGSLPLMDQPGERWRYNVGSMVLGVLIARAGGGSLGDVLSDRLFTRLGMTNTAFAASEAEIARMPSYYMSNPPGSGKPVLQPHSTPPEWLEEPPFPSASGGLLSTVDDVLSFARMLRNGGTHEGIRLLSAESVATMTTNH